MRTAARGGRVVVPWRLCTFPHDSWDPRPESQPCWGWRQITRTGDGTEVVFWRFCDTRPDWPHDQLARIDFLPSGPPISIARRCPLGAVAVTVRGAPHRRPVRVLT